jgi:hypothetical protein
MAVVAQWEMLLKKWLAQVLPFSERHMNLESDNPPIGKTDYKDYDGNINTGQNAAIRALRKQLSNGW